MCTPPTTKKVSNAWNGWLDERDLAPGEVISNWLKRHTQRGLSLAAEYAKLGYDKALERADVAWSARSLLDSGSPAQEAIDLKQKCDQAVAADAALMQMLTSLSSQYQEEAKFAKDLEICKAVGAWSQRYGQAAETLGPSPAAPQRSAVEQDAIYLLQLRQAQSRVANKLLGAPVKGTEGYKPATSSSSRPSARSEASKEQVQKLLQRLFELHDLRANGVLEEDELIKMNEKVSLLHYGKDGTDKQAIREKFQGVFREQLDPNGQPVPFSVFRDYMQGMLMSIDPNPDAQVMMVEQFIAEAESAREAFRFPSLVSESDQFFFPEAKAAPKPEAKKEAPRHTMADRVADHVANEASRDQPRQPGPQAAAPAAAKPPEVPADSLPTGHQPEQTFGQSESASGSSPVSGFLKGDALQVWSNSKSSWRDGQVLEVFPKACQAEGYSVPAGTLKVSFDAGTIKWVMPGQVASLLRRRPDG